MFAQVLSDGDAWRREKVLWMRTEREAFPVLKPAERRCGSAECAADVDTVPGTRSRAQNRFSLGNRADHHDVSQYPGWALGGVSPGQGDREALSQG